MRVLVKTYAESHQTTHWVALINERGQELTPYKFSRPEEAVTTAQDFADFLGVTMEPYEFEGKVVEPIWYMPRKYAESDELEDIRMEQEYERRSGRGGPRDPDGDERDMEGEE